ncbi:MAG: hypothetical protein WAQ83_04450, partial [Saprospiraceae bacterium]
MQVDDLVHIVRSLDILPHHARLGHAWTDDGAGSYEMNIIITFQLAYETTHSRRFYVKTTDASTGAQLVPHTFVQLDPFDIVY